MTKTFYIPRAPKLEVLNSYGTYDYFVYPCFRPYKQGCLVEAKVTWSKNKGWLLCLNTTASVGYNQNDDLLVDDLIYKFYDGQGTRIYPKLCGYGKNNYYSINYPKGYYTTEDTSGVICTQDYIIDTVPTLCNGTQIYNFQSNQFEPSLNIYNSSCHTVSRLADGSAQWLNTTPGNKVCINGNEEDKYLLSYPCATSGSSLKAGQYPVLGLPIGGGQGKPYYSERYTRKYYIDYSMQVWIKAEIPNTNLFRMFKILNLQQEVNQQVIQDAITLYSFIILLRSYIWLVIFEVPYGLIQDNGWPDPVFFSTPDNKYGLEPYSKGIKLSRSALARLDSFEFIRWDWISVQGISNGRACRWMMVETYRELRYRSVTIAPEECPTDKDLNELKINIVTTALPYIFYPIQLGNLTIDVGFQSYVKRVKYLTSNDSVRYGTFIYELPNGGLI